MLIETEPHIEGQETENVYYNQHFIEIAQVDSREKLLWLFDLADQITALPADVRAELLKNIPIAILFYEPSTRTSSSFQAAALALGMQVVAFQTMQYSSVAKGESLPDTIRSFEKTTAAEAIVLRHEKDSSSIEAAQAAFTSKVINAGSGKKEHPTQALLDFYTVFKSIGRMDDLTIMIGGDLRYGRTVQSFAMLAALGENIKLKFVSPEVLQAPKQLLAYLDAHGVEYEVMYGFNPEDAQDCDFIYWTRTQLERAQDEDLAEYGIKREEIPEITKEFIITEEIKEKLKGKKLLHPLPRVNEIAQTIGDDPEDEDVLFYEQMARGRQIRMALLLAILAENPQALMNEKLIDYLAEQEEKEQRRERYKQRNSVPGSNKDGYEADIKF